MPAIEQVGITIDRLEGEVAIVRTDNGEEFILPISLLPADSTEGSKLWLKIGFSGQQEVSQEEQARQLLRQILNRSS